MAVSRPTLTVVLPCYDERDNLAPLAERLTAVLERVAGGSFEVIFVDDGSGDGSGEFLDALHGDLIFARF